MLDQLKEAAATGEAKPGKLDHYGQRYVIDFELQRPGRTATVRSAWIMPAKAEVPRPATRYPAFLTSHGNPKRK